MPESRISSCIGCRLRRRKCDQVRPICSACDEIGLPVHLCVFKRMSLISKDSKTTLDLLRQRNETLKSELNQVGAQSDKDGAYLNSALKIKYEKQPFFKTVVEDDLTSLNHFGSTSWQAFVSTEPLLNALLMQYHAVLKHENVLFRQRDASSPNISQTEKDIQNLIETFPPSKGTSITSQIGLEENDHLKFIHQIIRQIEVLMPSVDVINRVLYLYHRYDSTQALGSWSFDSQSLERAVWNFLVISPEDPQKVTINLELPKDFYKIPHFLLFLPSLGYMAYLQNQIPTMETGVDPDLMLEYHDALYSLLHNYLVDNDSFLGYLYSVEAFQSIVVSRWARQFLPIPSKQYHPVALQTTVFVRRAVTLARVLNLNKNVDVYYAHKDAEIRRKLKTGWYAVVCSDNLQAFESGVPPKINEPFIKYPEIQTVLTKVPAVINEVLNAYKDIELIDDTYVFISLVEVKIIKPLKDILRTEFLPLDKDTGRLLKYNFDDFSKSQHFFECTQYIVVRAYIYASIQTFYYICFKRLRIIKDDDSELAQAIHIKTWKYSLAILSLQNCLFETFSRLLKHPAQMYYYPSPSLLMMVYPYLRLAQRRSFIFIFARLLEKLNIRDVPSLVDTFFFDENKQTNDDAVFERLEAENQYQTNFTILDYGELDIDDDHILLLKKFHVFKDWKFLSLQVAKLVLGMYKTLHNDGKEYGCVMYNYIQLAYLKMSKFFLHYAFPSGDKPSFNKNKLPNHAKQVEQFNKAYRAKADQFDFNKFFHGSFDTDDDDLHKSEELFKSLELPITGDSKFYYSWYKD